MKISEELLYLSKEQIQSVNVGIDECIDILTEVYKAKSNGEVVLPFPSIIGDPLKGSFFKSYVAGINKTGEYGMKWLGGNKENANIGVPSITGLIIINDSKTLSPIALMDCTFITGIRTAAVSGIAMRTLAREDTSTMTILGCGLQGRTHLSAAVASCPNLKTVYAYGPRVETAKQFKKEMGKKYTNLEIIVVEDVKKAIKESLLITSSTPFGAPELYEFMDSSYIFPGVTMISISGANHLLFDGYQGFDKHYVDDFEIVEYLKTRPQFKECDKMITGELGDVLTGRVEGRTSENDKIILTTEGIALNDIPIAHLIYRRALEKGIGTILLL